MSDIEILEEAYIKAANALTKYMDIYGFKPGVRVEAHYRKEPTKTGTIAPYGEMWSDVNHMSVPVLLDDGQLQPWNMSHLKVIAKGER